MNPLTGQFLGPNSAAGDRHARAEHRQPAPTAIFASGAGHRRNRTTSIRRSRSRRASARPGTSSGNQKFVVRGSAGLFFDRPPAQNVYNTVNNPPFSRNVTVRYGQLQDLNSAGLTTEAPPALTVWQYDEPLPSSVQWNTGVQMAMPFSTVLDVAYTGQHSYGFPTAGQHQRDRFRHGVSAADAGSDADQHGARRGVDRRAQPGSGAVLSAATAASAQQQTVRLAHVPLDAGRAEPALIRRLRARVRRHDRPLRSPAGAAAAAAQRRRHDHACAPIRRRPTSCSATTIRRRTSCAPTSSGSCRGSTASSAMRAPSACILNDWSLSGIWSGATGSAYTVTLHAPERRGNVNLTGSPDYAARVNVVGDPGERLQLRSATASSTPRRSRDRSPGAMASSRATATCGAVSSARSISPSRAPSGWAAPAVVQLRARHVQRCSTRQAITNRNTTMHLTSPAQPDRHPEPAVRRQRQRHRVPLQPARRRLRRRDRLPGAADDAVPGALRVLRAEVQ